MLEEIPNIVQEQTRLAKKILTLLNFILFPVALVSMMIVMDFRVMSRLVFGIFCFIELILIDAAIVALYFRMRRPISLFLDEWKSLEGNLPNESLENHWKTLTGLPFKMSIFSGGLIFICMVAGSAAMHLMRFYDLRQSMMHCSASLWVSILIGMATYAGIKINLAPALEQIYGVKPFAWAGMRLNFIAKMFVLTIVIAVLPILVLSLQAERWANESMKKFYRDTVVADIAGRAELIRNNWSPGMTPDFAKGSDKYFITTLATAENAGGIKRGSWEISLPDYLSAPISDGYYLARKLKDAEWKPYTRRVRFIAIFFFVLFSAISLAVAYAFGRSLRSSTANITALTRAIAHGQAFRYQHLVAYSDDDSGDLAIAFNEMLEAVRKQFGITEALLARVREAVEVLGSSTAEMRAVADRQAQDSHQQAGRVGELAGTGTEIAAAASEITEKSTSVKEAAEKTLESCREGIRRIEKAIDQIQEANRRAEEMVDRMKSLEEQFAEIEKVANTISDVSDRTELISLNAALEAAGAKKHGKRFGVVSAEVKRLAVLIGDMTNEIRGQIGSLRDTLQETATATRESASAVEEGVNGVATVQSNLDQLARTAERTYTSAIEINVSTRQQTQASERLAETLKEISDLATQVAQGSEESRKAIEDISQIALSLNDILWSSKEEL